MINKKKILNIFPTARTQEKHVEQDKNAKHIGKRRWRNIADGYLSRTSVIKSLNAIFSDELQENIRNNNSNDL
jgi:hypothetical protein